MSQDEPSDEVKGKSKTEDTIARLAQLLESTPSAEELSTTWTRSKNESLQQNGPRLQDLRRALDAGKVIERTNTPARGIPMWIVVRMCKATWHRDGTWPLVGADEEVTIEAQSLGIVRSIYSSAAILRPEGKFSFQVPLQEDARQRFEASAEDIANSYRKRGVFIEEAVSIQQEEDDG